MIAHGNVLARATFDQTDVDRPLLDLNEGAWKDPSLNKSLGTERAKTGQLTEEEKDEMFMQFGGKAAREKAASLSQQKGFSLVSNSKIKLHEKVLSMVFDDVKHRLYSVGLERKLMITDLRPSFSGQRMFRFIKLANGNPVTLEIASESSRLFCATKEGHLLVFAIDR